MRLRRARRLFVRVATSGARFLPVDLTDDLAVLRLSEVMRAHGLYAETVTERAACVDVLRLAHQLHISEHDRPLDWIAWIRCHGYDPATRAIDEIPRRARRQARLESGETPED